MRKILIAMILGMGSLVANAIDPFVELAPIITGDNAASFNIQGGITHKVHPYIRIGAGAGFTQDWNFEYGPMIPVFVRAQAEKSFGGITPYLSFDLGYEINTESSKYGAILLNPMLGVQIGRFYGGVGYLGHCYTEGDGITGSNFVLRLGVTF